MSTNGIHQALVALRRRGLVTWREGAARTLLVTEAGRAVAAPHVARHAPDPVPDAREDAARDIGAPRASSCAGGPSGATGAGDSAAPCGPCGNPVDNEGLDTPGMIRYE